MAVFAAAATSRGIVFDARFYDKSRDLLGIALADIHGVISLGFAARGSSQSPFAQRVNNVAFWKHH